MATSKITAIITAAPYEFRQFVRDHSVSKSLRFKRITPKFIEFEDETAFAMVSSPEDCRGLLFGGFEQLGRTPTDINEVRFAVEARIKENA